MKMSKTVRSINLRKLKKPAALCISILFIISIFAISATRADSGGTIIFSSGFEDGFNSWTSTNGGVSVVSSPVYSGNYAMRAEYWGSQATESVGSQSEVYTSAEFYLDRNLAGSQSLIAYFDANSHATVAMGLSVQSGSAYAFVQTIFPGYRYQQYNLTNLPPAVWYKFALDVSATSATIYLNDQQLTSLSQTNIPATASVSVGMFWGDGSYTGNLYVDNVQIGTSAGGNPTSTPTPTPTPTPSPTPTLSGTSIFSSGFENGFASWTATQGGVSIVTSPVYSGNYAMKAEYWGSRAIESIGTESETYTEAEFYFDQTLAGSQSLIAYFDGSGYATVAMGLSVQSGRVLVFVQTILPSYGYRQYELTGVTPGTWYKFALDASATSATIYMNDQKLASINQTNIPATASVSVGILYEDGVYTGNLYVDNVQISSPSPEPTWSQTYGGTGISYGQSVVRTADGGYAVTGGTNSFGNYNGDIYLVKTSSTGIPQWNQTYGGVGYSVIQTSDGGYAIAGETSSFGVYDQVYLVKTDSAGTMLWNKAYGGTSSAGYSVIQTSDGGYAIAGYTYSYGSGMGDVYLVKTDSSGNLLWNKTYGGTGDDGGQSVVQTSDGGYAIAGYTGSFGAGGLDVYLVKTDASGNLLWNKTYGGTGDDVGYSVVQSSDGGYAIAGYTSPQHERSPPRPTNYGNNVINVYLVKTDVNGNLG